MHIVESEHDEQLAIHSLHYALVTASAKEHKEQALFFTKYVAAQV